jgi:RNA polymerase sigma-70 factor (ECF subfamily)
MIDKEQLNSLFRYAISLTNNEEFAYDLLSHSLEKMLLRPLIINKMAYLKKSIRNKFYDEFKKKSEQNINIEEQSSLTDLEQLVIDKDLVQKILNQLHPLERELLYLWALEGYSLSEIGKLQEISRGTLTSRLYRLKKKIQHFEKEWGINE